MNKEFLPKDWDKVHHAYIVSGVEPSLIWQELEENLEFKKRGNPDAKEEIHETFGIEEARNLNEWAIMRPVASNRKVALISASVLTAEAQNALLKLFEEPPQGTYFFIVLPNALTILETLLSRIRVVSFKREAEDLKKFNSFLSDSIATRLSKVSPLIKSKDKEKVREVIRFLAEKINKEESQKKKHAMAEKMIQAERYIGVRGMSTKMILEYLALSL